MTCQQTLHEDSFTAKDFLFADGRQMDLRLAYWTMKPCFPKSPPSRIAATTR